MDRLCPTRRPRGARAGPVAVAGMLAAALAGGSAGCAGFGWDGTLEVAVAPVTAPENGRPVRIASVEDRRVFRKVAHALRTPSLAGGGEGRSPARAVGRRGGTRGGNLWLAGDETVGSLVADATAAAFARAGYRPVASDAAEPDALEVSVEILAFWTWMRPVEFAPDLLQSEIEVRLRAPLGALEDGVMACGKADRSTPAPSAGAWSAVVEGALADLGSDLDRLLSAPGRPPPAWRCRPPDSP